MVSFMYRGSTVPVERLRVYEFVIARNTTARVKIYTRAFVHACAEEGKKEKIKTERTNKRKIVKERKREGAGEREGGRKRRIKRDRGLLRAGKNFKCDVYDEAAI